MTFEDYTLKQKDMQILTIMMKHTYVLPNNTATIKVICNIVNTELEEPISEPTIYRIVQNLVKVGILKEGLRDGRIKSFYVSVEGADKIVEYTNTTDTQKIKLIEAYKKIQQPKAQNNDWNDILIEQRFKAGAWDHIPPEKLVELQRQFPHIQKKEKN